MSEVIHEAIRVQDAQAIADEYAYSPRLEMAFEITDLRARLERAEGLLRLWMCGSVDPVEGETELQKDTSSFLRGD